MRPTTNSKRGQTARLMCTVAASFALVMLSVSRGNAQEGERTSIAAPLRIVGGDATAVDLRIEASEDAFAALSPHRVVTLTGFPLAPGLAVDLEIERFWAWGPATRFVIGTDGGDIPMDAPTVAFFRGVVAGEPESRVFLSASSRGLKGIIRVGEAQYVLSPRVAQGNAADKKLHTIVELFSAGAAAPPAAFECEPLLAPGQQLPIATEPPAMPRGAVSRVALVALEADYEFGQLFVSLPEAASYACELLAVTSTFYEADINMKLAASFVRIWDTPADPYDAAGSGDQLVQFKDYWEANMGSVERNAAHLVSGRNLGGGTAYLDQMCGGAFAYGVSGNMAGTFPTPIQDGLPGNWDIVVVPHELGHNFRSPHTHCYEPPVDMCQSTMGACWEGPQECQQGTIMSYCHLCPGGMSNIDLTFGPTVSAYILDGLQSCIGQSRDPCFVDSSFAGVEMGTESNPYQTVAKGTWFVAPAGTVSIAAGNYPESLMICQPMTLSASGGTVVIGN